MKSYEQVYQEVIDLITAKTHTENVAPHSSVFDLTADSIQLFELVMAFEEKFKITASYEDMMNISTIADITELIHRKVALAHAKI